MKNIKYIMMTRVNHGTEDEPHIIESFHTKQLHYCKENLSIAQEEAYNGEYEIVDDGELEPPPTTEQRVSYLEEQLVQADETAITLYEAQEKQEVINAQQDEALMELYEMKS